jgi:transcriptional regulator with XRE-family HTH domain
MSKPNWQTTLATKIKATRKLLGLSQREFGKLLKLSDKAVSTYEVGRAVPTVETLIELSQTASKPIGYFFEELTPDLELQIKLKQIEKELLEAKQQMTKSLKAK